MPDAGDPKPTTLTSTPSGLAQVGSYRIVEPLGSGGMSSVFRAAHVETGHVVALKVLPRTLAKNTTLLQRFLREAKSAEALEHPNIVAIFDRGSEDGRYYLVLEYISGGDLHDRVRNGPPLSAAEAIRITLGVCEGLRHAAARGLIHRDIKPANILLTADGSPKVADLGLAVQVEEEDERVTRDGTTVGTVDYMAPEQARDSRATSVRSDIYSLGCTLYHILAGVPPFAGGDVPNKLRRHAFDPPPDVRTLRPDVPEALARLIQRMMAKKPEGRPKDYAELIAELGALPAAPETGQAPLVALFDDEPEGPVFALIDDDAPGVDARGAPVPTGSTAEAATIGPRPAPGKRSRPGGATPPPAAQEVSMAELAALDEDEPAPRRSGRRAPGLAPAAPRAPAGLDDDIIPLAGGGKPLRRSYDEGSLRDWILRGVMIGLAIVLVGFGLVQLISLQFGSPPAPGEPPPGAGREPAGTDEPAPPSPLLFRPGPKGTPIVAAPQVVSRAEAPLLSPPRPPGAGAKGRWSRNGPRDGSAVAEP